MEKINIAELLKDCPSGMELDCVMYENLYFDYIDNNKIYPIYCYTEDNLKAKHPINFTWYGRPSKHDSAKCVIFPKNRTTWEGFVPPCKFEDGDIVTWKENGSLVAFIYKERKNSNMVRHHFALYVGGLGTTMNEEILIKDDELRFATKEEKEKLFQAIKDNGYSWNTETKTLEKLVEPIFKVGDRIVHKKNRKTPFVITEITKQSYKGGTQFEVLIEQQDNFELVPTIVPKFKVGDIIRQKGDYISGVVVEIDKDYYYKVEYKEGSVSYVNIEAQNNWELSPNKFDITTLKPFESRVLVRDNKTEVWKLAYWGFYDEMNSMNYPYETVGGNCFSMCIPYEGNEYLFKTNNDCDDYYKTWKYE